MNPQDRRWLDIIAAEQDEVIVQVELMRRCAGKKVKKMSSVRKMVFLLKYCCSPETL